MVEDFDSNWYVNASTNQVWAYSYWYRARSLEKAISTGPFQYPHRKVRVEELEVVSWCFLFLDVWEM